MAKSSPRLQKALATFREHTGNSGLAVANPLPDEPASMKDLWEIMFATTYGDSWSRPGLDLRTKSFLCMAVTASLGLEREFKLHVKSAQHVGVSKDELVEMLIHLFGYIGAPRTAAAAAAVREIWKDAGSAAKTKPTQKASVTRRSRRSS